MPFGPYLRPGIREVVGVEKLREKLLVRVLVAAIAVTIFFSYKARRERERATVEDLLNGPLIFSSHNFFHYSYIRVLW